MPFRVGDEVQVIIKEGCRLFPKDYYALGPDCSQEHYFYGLDKAVILKVDSNNFKSHPYSLEFREGTQNYYHQWLKGYASEDELTLLPKGTIQENHNVDPLSFSLEYFENEG